MLIYQEQSLSWPEAAVTYTLLDALPSFRPAKKYSDLTGTVGTALYTHVVPSEYLLHGNKAGV